MRTVRRRLALALLALALLAGAAAVAARWRASRLPAVEFPVLLWEAVADDPGDDPATTSKTLFIEQISDLWNDPWKGPFETVSPSRLRQYSTWGRPLPDQPVLLRLARPLASLVEKDGVEAILAGAGFEAFVDLPSEDVEAGEPGLLSWDEVRAAAERGTLRFAPCVSARTNATLSLERAVALFRERTGLRVDAVSYRDGDPPVPPSELGATFGLLDAPGGAGWGGRSADVFGRIAVLGGQHSFALELRQDSVDPALFGTLAISHPTGANPPPGGRPLVLVVLQKDGYDDPLVVEPIAVAGEDGAPRPIGPGETFRAALSAAPRFPLEVRVYDGSMPVLYFRRTLFRNEARRDPSWRPPVLDPKDRLEIEPL